MFFKSFAFILKKREKQLNHLPDWHVKELRSLVTIAINYNKYMFSIIKSYP